MCKDKNGDIKDKNGDNTKYGLIIILYFVWILW